MGESPISTTEVHLKTNNNNKCICQGKIKIHRRKRCRKGRIGNKLKGWVIGCTGFLAGLTIIYSRSVFWETVMHKTLGGTKDESGTYRPCPRE